MATPAATVDVDAVVILLIISRIDGVIHVESGY